MRGRGEGGGGGGWYAKRGVFAPVGLYMILPLPILYWCMAYKRGVGGASYIAQ